MSVSVITIDDVAMRPMLLATYMRNKKIVRPLLDHGAETAPIGPRMTRTRI